MKYLIGIDGGGTKTLLRAADFDLNSLGEVKGGASNLTALDEEAVKNNLTKLLNDFYAQNDLKREDCAALVLGTAGATTAGAQAVLKEHFANIMPGVPVTITSDAIPMLYAGSGAGTGMVLVSGTGSVCFGRNSEGTLFRAGGWGHIIGDEGGGYALGRDSLIAIMEAFDGRGPKTVLTDMIYTELGLKDPPDLLDWVYRRNNGKAEIAALSRFTEKAAIQGDEAALGIFDKAAYDLARLIGAVAANLPPEGHVCVITGSNLTKAPILREKLAALQPDIRFIVSEKDAADGCLIMAKEMI